MKIDEILAGESKNVEFKESLPVKSSKYMKTIVAFANGQVVSSLSVLKMIREKLSALTRTKRFKLWMP